MYGIIDIGSNSIRLMKCVGRENHKEVITTRLAEGMKDGYLNARAIERSVAAIKELAQSIGGGRVYAYATEAVRSAANKREFIEKVKSACGIVIDVLSGEEEAKCSYLGAISGLNDTSRVMTAVIDIGGASTEITVGDGGEPIYAKSVPLGIVRLKDACGENDEAINEYLKRFIIEGIDVSARAERLIGIGGTVTSLAAIALELKTYDRNAVHGYTLNRSKIKEIKELIKNTPIDKRAGIAGLNPSRTSTIYQGVRILETITDILGISEVTASEADNLEGYAITRGIK